MNDTRGAITLEGDTLYKLDYWTKLFNEPRSAGATEYIEVGMVRNERWFRDDDKCPILLDGLEEYKKLRRAGAGNGELREVIERMQKELGREVVPV